MRYPGSCALLLLLGGCAAVGPDYAAPPKIEMAAEWSNSADPAFLPTGQSIKNWWTLFNDPLLNELIDAASKNNLDVRVALASVAEARAQLGIINGDKAPVVGIGADAVRGDGLDPGGSIDTRYTTGLDATWEIDLFGQIRREVEAATADYQATEEQLNDVMITLYAEVARTYLTIRALQASLVAATGNIESQKQVLDLTRKRFKHGLSTDLDVAQAKRTLALSEAKVPPLKINLSEAINTISVLIGQAPGKLNKRLENIQPVPLPEGPVTVGVPSTLLRQRPDIRKAERQLAAQVARIGVAKGELYPKLSLNGTFNFSATDAGALFSGNNSGFSFGPSLRWNIFQGGKVRNLIKAEDARTLQALFIYERTVLNALNEAENAMTAYLEQQVQFEAQKRALSAAKRSHELATSLYKQGLSDFQNVLDAQTALFDTENQVAGARGQTAVNLVAIYKSIGGGWDPNVPFESQIDLETATEKFIKPLTKEKK